MEKISIDEAFIKARNIAKKKSPKATFLLDYAVSKHIREYLNLCYAYLRWVDDVVDNPEIALSTRKSFINKQKSLIESYKDNLTQEPTEIEEYFLYYFVEFAIQNNMNVLIDSVYQMVDTISWDVERLESDGVFSQEQLDSYINTQSESFFNILYYFSTEKDPHKQFDIDLGISNAITRLYMIRDLKVDINSGFINVSREDLARYNIDINNLILDKNLSIWIEDKVKYILSALYNESTKLRLMSFKIRIFHFYSNFYYLPKIIRYRVYGCFIGSSDKRSVFKEIETFWQSFLISLKLFNNIFINKNNDHC